MTNFTHDQVKPWKGGVSYSSQVAVIRREFVDLTGDHFSAVVLNQLLYWTQRVKDFDLLLEEERSFNPDCNVLPRHGWIYKTAPELVEETMLKISPPTMRKYLKLLIDHGWIDERPNPFDRWNKTTQYRVNLRKLQEDLQTIGHTLPEVYGGGFPSSLEEKIYPNSFSKATLLGGKNESVSFSHSNERSYGLSSSSPCLSNQASKQRNLSSKERVFGPEIKNFASKQKIFPSKERNFSSYTYTENTTENKNREHAQRTCAREDFDEFFEIWKKHVCPEALQLTETRKRQLRSLLSLHFQNDVQQWEQFCERIKASPFLMGEGDRRWHVTLDWILIEDNVLKVLEGNFDDPESVQLKKSEDIQPIREKECFDILTSIADPIWQDWCTQLSHFDQKKDPLSLLTLKEIASARFTEFDGKLVWIESEDRQVLRRIEDLRLKLLTVAQRTFPNARNIRTQLSLLKGEGDSLTSDSCSLEHHLNHENKRIPLDIPFENKQPIRGELHAE